MKQSVLTLLTWDEVREIFIEARSALRLIELKARNTGKMYVMDVDLRDYYKGILRSLREKYNRPSPIAERYAEVLPAAEEAVGVKLNPRRDTLTTTVRSFVAYQLHKEGYSYTDIARMMGLNHSSVIHLVERKENALSVPGAYKSETEMFNRFNELLGHEQK